MGLGDLCTLEDVKRAHGLTTDVYDAAIVQYITEASDAVHRACRPRILIRDTTASDRYYTARDAVDGELLIDDLTAEPTAVAFLTAAGEISWTLNIPADVIAEPRNRDASEPITSLRFRPSVPAVTTAAEIRVTGVWGFPQIPDSAVNATIEAVRHWLRTTQAVSTQAPETDDTGRAAIAALPSRSREMLKPLRGLRVA